VLKTRSGDDTGLVRLVVALLSVLAALSWAAPAPAHDVPGTAPLRLVADDVAVPAQTPAPAVPWCGDERATDDTRHQSTPMRHRLQALYLVPADAPSRFAALAPQIAGAAEAANGILERSRGRSLRFDRGTRCGARHLDISTVRLPLTTAQLAAAAADDTTLERVGRALAARGRRVLRDDQLFDRSAGEVNYVAWLDGPAPAGSCGQAPVISDPRRSETNDNAYGGKLALVFRDGDGFCGPQTVLHETAHLLGAVQDPAPHATSDGHCNDAGQDLMCLGADAADPVIDAGSDDYWDPPAGAPLRWWTLNLSPFLCERSGCAGDARTATASRRRAARRAFRG
jgi:hypothetical protein